MNFAISECLAKESKQTILDDLIDKTLVEMREILGDYKQSQKLYNIIENTLISSGKMIRTKLLIYISLMGENQISDKIISQCAAVEITHLASLIHDDIIDDSLIRRSHRSIQSKYGKDVAVFAGDYMISKVFSYLAKKGLVEEISIISDTIRDMCNGEVGQNLIKYRLDISEKEYFENICGKTASFFKTVCYFGAKNAGFNQIDINKMVEFGKNLGLMFQLRDDILDLFSSKDETGKGEFVDVKEGVYTYPLLSSMNDDKYGDEIYKLLNKNKEVSLNYDELLTLRQLLIESKACILSSKKIKEFADKNRLILASLPIRESDYLYKILDKIEKN